MTGQPLEPAAREERVIETAWLRRRVLSWFRENGRDFPWRRTSDPYAVLIAEVLLQRTRADLVEPLYELFLVQYPDGETLSRADPCDVVELLRPLGFLHRSARLPALGLALMNDHRGRVPCRKSSLLALPGVGQYAANAVLTIALRQPEPLLDPNVVRVVERLYSRSSLRARPRDDASLWQFVGELLPPRAAREFNLGLVDLGAIVCRPRRPRCPVCPLRQRCPARSERGT